MCFSCSRVCEERMFTAAHNDIIPNRLYRLSHFHSEHMESTLLLMILPRLLVFILSLHSFEYACVNILLKFTHLYEQSESYSRIRNHDNRRRNKRKNNKRKKNSSIWNTNRYVSTWEAIFRDSSENDGKTTLKYKNAYSHA